MDFLEIAGGIIFLLVGGELLVRGAVKVAQSFRVSPLVIGLTLVGFGTSAPELATSLDAAIMGAPGIAIGNVVGSNIANVLLIIGASALLAPILCDRGPILREGLAMIGATALLTGAVLLGELSRPAGFVLVAGLVAYLVWAWRNGRNDERNGNDDAEAETPDTNKWRAVMLPVATAILGLGVIVLGADLLVRGAIDIAERVGLSQTIIGLTIVAVGTSLPELATAMIAAWRGQSDMAIGNVIGSNIFNILGIAGITAAVHPIGIDSEIAQFDIWVMGAAAIALIVMALTGGRITRTEGAGLLGAYGLYVVVLLA